MRGREEPVELTWTGDLPLEAALSFLVVRSEAGLALLHEMPSHVRRCVPAAALAVGLLGRALV